MNSKIICLLICEVASQLIKPSHFTSLGGGPISVDLYFSRINGNHILSASKNPLIITNLHIYRAPTEFFKDLKNDPNIRAVKLRLISSRTDLSMLKSITHVS
jgi:hypothetical protein